MSVYVGIDVHRKRSRVRWSMRAFGWGWLPGAAGGLRLRAAHGAPAAVQGDRLGTGHRAQLVRLRTLLRNRIHVILADHRPDEEVRQRAKAGPRVKALTQLPGVGPFTALVLLAEIGDFSRFGSARKLASRVGLTPAVRGSDRTVHHGHVSKEGPAWVRWVT